MLIVLRVVIAAEASSRVLKRDTVSTMTEPVTARVISTWEGLMACMAARRAMNMGRLKSDSAMLMVNVALIACVGTRRRSQISAPVYLWFTGAGHRTVAQTADVRHAQNC